MKKILLGILIVLLLALCCITALNGINVFGIEILGINQVKEKSGQLDTTISEATVLASTDYQKTLNDIEADMKKLKEEKKTYNDLVTVSSGSDVEAANQYQKYEIEYLWTQLGNLATSEGIDLKIDLVSGTGNNIYNLNFTAKGTYIGIADFIYDIENDSALGFKIENFSLTPGGGTDQLQATFTCKNIEIKELAKGSINSQTNDEEINQTNTTSATNTANTTNTTNTTNALNTNTSTNTTNTTR